jgi:hypothetical protein
MNDRAVEVLQVIRTTLLRRGKGIEGDPVRIITQYWLMDGTLLFEHDPAPPTDTTEAPDHGWRLYFDPETHRWEFNPDASSGGEVTRRRIF